MTDNEAFHVEHRGIEVVGDDARRGRSIDLFWIWFAGNITILGIPIGAVLVSLGLTLKEALIIDVVGCLSFFIVGLAAISGARAGTSTLALSRAAFGMRGNVAMSGLSWITLVGWETISLIVGTYALLELANYVGIRTNDFVTVVCLLLMAVGTFSVTVLGHRTIVIVQKGCTILFGLLSAVLVGFLLSHYKASHVVVPPATGHISTTIILGLSIMFASTVFAWINYASDYTRYLPRQTKARSIVWWTGIGAIIPGSILIGTGVIVGAQVGLASAANPIKALATLIPTWLTVPLLLTAVASQLTSNFLNSYSSGLSLQACGIKLARPKAVLLDGTISVLAGLYAVLISNFESTFTSFLSLEVVWIASWSAVYLADAFYRLRMTKLGYEAEDLFKWKTGQYWYRNGYNWAAISCWVVGSVGAFLFTNSTLWHSPLTVDWLGGADMSVFVGFVVSGGSYLAVLTLSRRPGTELTGELKPAVARTPPVS